MLLQPIICPLFQAWRYLLDKNGVPLTDKPIEFQINQVLENLSTLAL